MAENESSKAGDGEREEGKEEKSIDLFSLGGHVESQGNKKLCFCTACLAHT